MICKRNKKTSQEKSKMGFRKKGAVTAGISPQTAVF